MGDVGDYWNEHRDFKRAARSMWHECTSPGCQFGGNPVKVAPGSKCRHCGVRAPGQRGSDVLHAREIAAQHIIDKAKNANRKAEKLALRTCHFGKIFKSENAMRDHKRDKHAVAVNSH